MAFQETSLDFARSLHRLNSMMILISYLPYPDVDPNKIPDEYKEGNKKHETYKQLIHTIERSITGKIEEVGVGVTSEELTTLFFPTQNEINKDLADYITKEAHKKKKQFSEEVSFERDTLEAIDDANVDGYLEYLSFNERDDDGVFGIVVNEDKKRITVVFRGSQNSGDWATNLTFLMHKETIGERPVRVHEGFWDRMTQKSERVDINDNNDNNNNNKISLFLRIKERLVAVADCLKKKDPSSSYSLCVTGHSLGGALATFCGVLLATNEDILHSFFASPITILSVAAPRVGDHNFRCLHQHLEVKGLLRHLRIMNVDDIVPTLPKWGGHPYEHVGLRWLLSEQKNDPENETETKKVNLEMKYSDATSRKISVASVWGSAENHFTWVYRDRLMKVADDKDCHPDTKLSIDELFGKYLKPITDA